MNVSEILKRALVEDYERMESMFDNYLKIDNGMDNLLLFVTDAELAKLTKEDSFGNVIVDIPENKLERLWSEYYHKQDAKRKKNLQNINAKKIPKLNGMEYERVADKFSPEEWIKVINSEYLIETNRYGQARAVPVKVLEDYKIERLYNRTDINDTCIYNVLIKNDNKFVPLSYVELKDIVKIIPPYLILPDEYTESFKGFLSQEEFQKIKKRELMLLISNTDEMLLVSTLD